MHRAEFRSFITKIYHSHFSVISWRFPRHTVRSLRTRSDTKMNMPEWSKPAAYGAVAGAAAMAFVGFSWGGWVTAGTAQELTAKATTAAVAAAMTPYCVQMAGTDPRSAEILAELKTAKGYNGRMVIEKAGWATPIGADKPNSELASACQTALSAS